MDGVVRKKIGDAFYRMVNLLNRLFEKIEILTIIVNEYGCFYHVCRAEKWSYNKIGIYLNINLFVSK